MHISLSADDDEPFVIIRNVYPYQKETSQLFGQVHRYSMGKAGWHLIMGKRYRTYNRYKYIRRT